MAGTFLRQMLKQVGVNLDRDALTTNALICHPPSNKTPDDKQISYCRPNVLNAIQLYQPKVVVTLGRSALTSVLAAYWSDVGPLERWTGWKIPLESYWICPTYHPSYLLRMKNSLLDRIFQAHLSDAFRIQQDPPRRMDLDQEIEVLYEEDEIEEVLHGMDEQGGWVAVDYEMNCLKPELPKARIASCAVSNGVRTISYPWSGKAILATAGFLKSKRTRKIASNLKFEERWTLKQFGHGVSNWGWDTMLATHCLDNRPGICSLKFQALVRMGIPSYHGHIEPYLFNYRGPYNRIHEIALKDLLFYGGTDALLEHRLATIQREEMGYED